ncbi:hypothetical protein GLOTRDRAFT_137669 [Gloeophyllum trabeum ATCC 11539]|uniref:BAG domain-containing protein n=1 Tax=Gloeophyllum trabeum (strain ATCC 11539 / FP-39264 / Madison 617) TaxID=670483 RepID=S7QD50_GLOTA|nr:uncharacterized protein GLOTRDRAFT_137669 [Gloeophyllum trabeum ATCC 11539]EPQ57318.1 hypothetical protein GLOTRDRAFT_137669 [Gloeophyllum trabeum ATCC 11539]
MSYVVKWGRERLHFPLPDPSTKLSYIRRQIADYTHLPEDSFKLVHGGAVMKDDNAPLSAYSIRPNSTIALIGGEPLPTPPKSSKSSKPDKNEPRTEQSTLAQIRAERQGVQNGLAKEVDAFVANLPPTPPQQEQVKTMQPTHARLSELLLQSLLRLDAINAEGGWDEARKERKEAVKEVQKVLDRLDGAWAGIKGRR